MLHSIVRRRDPEFEFVGLGEGYCSLTGWVKSRVEAGETQIEVKIAELLAAVRQEVFEETGGLQLKIACAPNRFLARLMSQFSSKENAPVLRKTPEAIRAQSAKVELFRVPQISKHKKRIFEGFGRGGR